jgi:transposase-like protein
VVFWRLRYKLSLRDLAEMFLARGFLFTHETVRDWEERFAPLIADQLRTKRRGQAGISWYVDETDVKVHGKWCYLSRAIDQDGNLVDSRLSEKRDMDAAKQFFKQAGARVGHTPEQVTTDGHTSYPRAIRETMSSNVQHRTNKYLNNRLQPGSSRDQATLLSDAWFRNL